MNRVIAPSVGVGWQGAEGTVAIERPNATLFFLACSCPHCSLNEATPQRRHFSRYSHFGGRFGVGIVQEVSFNLSGPFSLMVCSWFFANLQLSKEDFHRLLKTALGPIVGIASIALYFTLTATEIYFTDESNFTTSGSFGPNQVASALGLEALFALLYILTEEKHTRLKTVMFALMLFLASQSALTFSRGGLWIAGISGLVVFLYLVRDKQTRFRVLSIVGLLFIIGFLCLNWMLSPMGHFRSIFATYLQLTAIYSSALILQFLRSIQF